MIKGFLNQKQMAWIITHCMFIVMATVLAFDYTKWNVILPYAAYCAIFFFILTLSLNPLISVKPYRWLLIMNRYRRQTGVASYSYALLHAVCFLIKRLIDGKWVYLLHPAILPVLIVGMPILLSLSLTSNQYAIKKLSFARWKNLHKKVYIAELAIFCHLFLSGAKLLGMLTFGPLITLQLIQRYKAKIK